MIQQNTLEWHELRQRSVGASDAPVIMGDSPWKTSYELWEEKLGLRPLPQMNEAMRRGHELEPIARQAYNDYTGNLTEPEVIFHPTRKWMVSSLDGISLDRSIIVEIKCPGRVDHELASQGIIPDKYYAQLQHQLATIGLNLLHYFSYKDGNFYLIEVPRDEKYIQKIYVKEEKFWQNLQDFNPPELTDMDYVQREDSEWINQAQQWTNVNRELKALQEKENEYRERLIQLSSNKNCMGAGIRVQKVIRKGLVDYKAIPELEGKDLEKYRKAHIETWRLSCGTKQCGMMNL